MSNERIVLLTPQEAESLLLDGEYVHTYRQAGTVFIGTDWSREEAITAFANALRLEIGGPTCQGMGHPIVVTDRTGHVFFAADMDKVSAMEAAKLGEAA